MRQASRRRSLDCRKADFSRRNLAARRRKSIQASGSKPEFGCLIQFRREKLPPLAVLETEWRRLERVAAPSFFISWHWIGTFLSALPAGKRPDLLRGSLDGETVALVSLRRGPPSVKGGDERRFDHRMRRGEGKCPQTQLWAQTSSGGTDRGRSL